MPNDLQLKVTSTTPDLELVLTDYVGSAYSPQVEVEDIDGGHNVSITHKGPDGIVTDSFDVMDGVSPTVDITSTAERHTITITDAQGPHVYEVDTYADEELARATAENGRASAESARVSAESARADAETGRSTAESTRDEAESARSAAEATRAENEGTRVTNETARANAEIARNASEQAREQAETSREAAWVTLSEQATTATQAANNAAQTASQAASDANDAAQAASQTATSVDLAEQGRVQAEQARVTAEQGRATAEQGRVSAETARATEWSEIESDAQDAIQAAQSATEAATDAAALATRAAASTWNAGNVLKGTLAEGIVLTTDDAWAAPPESVDVFGVSTQVTTTGKNLLDVSNLLAGYIIANGNVYGSGTDYMHTDYLAVSGGSTYTLSMTSTAPALYTAWYDAEKEFIDAATQSNKSSVVISLPQNAAFLRVSVNTAYKNTYQLELGSTTTSYEPYTGGKPAPSPDFPQPIKSVDDLTLWLCGKNLFDPSHLLEASDWTVSNGVYTGWSSALHTSFVNGYPLPPFVANTRYTLSFDFDYDGNDVVALTVNFTHADGTQDVRYVNAKNSHQVLTSSAGRTLTAIGLSYGTNRVIRLSNIQVEQASTATAYEPYVGQSVQIPLDDHSLRSLPDGTRDTLTLSYIGPSETEGWGVFGASLKQYVGESDMGDLAWSYSVSNTYAFFFASLESAGVAAAKENALTIMCTDYQAAQNATINTIRSSMVNLTTKMRNNYKNVYVKDDEYTTAADFTAAVTGAKLVYPLETPITTDLGTVELPILPNPLAAWADGGSAQPTLSMGYEQDINIVIAGLRDAIADMATS